VANSGRSFSLIKCVVHMTWSCGVCRVIRSSRRQMSGRASLILVFPTYRSVAFMIMDCNYAERAYCCNVEDDIQLVQTLRCTVILYIAGVSDIMMISMQSTIIMYV